MLTFEKYENFFRRVPNNPNMFRSDGTLSSAAFKDSNGCSVDRQSDRTKEETISVLFNRFVYHESETKAIAIVTYSDCLKASTVVKTDAIPNNEYHCLILRSDNDEKKQLTSHQARKLAEAARVHTFKI